MAVIGIDRYQYYDDVSFDYRSFWLGREYESKSETIVLKDFFAEISRYRDVSKLSLLDIGAGFGRLARFYLPKVKEATLLEPSSKLFNQARKNLGDFDNFSLKIGSIEKNNLAREKFDIVLLVRVAHHLVSLEKAFLKIEELTKPGGFLVLEFANKVHFKNVVSSILGKNKFSLSTKKIDRRSRKKKEARSIPVYNYHPSWIKKELQKAGFSIVKERSVSNLRSPAFKKTLPLFLLIFLETITQKLFSSMEFGPSVFILARKK